ENNSRLTGNITLNPQVTETNTLSDMVVTLDDEQINTSYETTAYELGDGQHTISVFAKDAAGNEASKAASFIVEGATITVTSGGASDITETSASLYLTLQNVNSDTKATFYKAEKVDTSSITTNTVEGILPYIQYTINVGSIKDNETVVANWDGEASNSDGTHASKMYVLNTETNNWDEIAKADENGSIKEASFAAANHVKDGIATIIVQCSADSSLPDMNTATDGVSDINKGWDGTNIPQDYDFCFAWETDTQYYAEEWPDHYDNINNWIVENADELKIKYVIHTGDIVDDVDMIYEWENADKSMSILDNAGMPYGVLGGNHDVAAGLADYENYYTYFGEDRFKTQPTYGGSYKNNRGHYDLISENGQDFIILYMSWNIYQDEIDWMNEILQKYSDRKAILCFHTYTNVKKSSDTYLDYYGQLIKEQVVANNPNVFAVLNGHYHGSSYETAMFDDNGDGQYDRTVYQICTDYQSGFEGGNEYIKFLYFDLDNNKIYMNSYSPCMDDFNFYDTELQTLNVEGASATGVDPMVLDVEFNTNVQSILQKSFSAYVLTDEEIGTAEFNKVTKTATVEMNNLKENTNYMWYAVVKNTSTGIVSTNVYEFTTASKASNSDTSITDRSDTVKTGDNRLLWLLTWLSVAGAAACAGIIIVIKKQEV
ncbi:MAG: metallophosphoesterase, partial [Lachnospira sp.]